MTQFEYKVVPAPLRGEKVKGAKTTEARFAHALMGVMNELGAEGWEYIRADTLPCEERVGLTGRTTRFQNMLVFRRTLASEAVVSDARPAETRNASDELRAAAARRLAETLTVKPEEGTAPKLRRVSEPGNAPAVGAAARGNDSGVAAE